MKINQIRSIKRTARINGDTAVIVGEATAGAGWYVLMLWPSRDKVSDDPLTDIGRHAEIAASDLARECGLLNEADMRGQDLTDSLTGFPSPA